MRQTLRLRRQEPGDEQQRVAGQEETDQQPGLGEDDQRGECQPALVEPVLDVEQGQHVEGGAISPVVGVHDRARLAVGEDDRADQHGQRRSGDREASAVVVLAG